MGITAFAEKDGNFKRKDSQFRDAISAKADARFPPEKGRYHLYVSYACPWAHRALIVRKLKGLEDVISYSVVHPFMGEKGWSFDGEGYEGHGSHGKDMMEGVEDPLYHATALRDLYFKANKDYEGRFTVPTLWDKKTETIVNNESAEIIRFLNSEFNALLDAKYSSVDLYPAKLQKEIDEINAWVYDTVNKCILYDEASAHPQTLRSGVYKSGFATTQEAYEKNVKPLFASLDRLEKILEGKDYLVGGQLTEADVRLFTTIIRFDPVYVGHFKCNIGTIRHNYPNLHRWLRQLYWQNEAFSETTRFDHIKIHYFSSHSQISPTRIVPEGPIPNIEKL